MREIIRTIAGAVLFGAVATTSAVALPGNSVPTAPVPLTTQVQWVCDPYRCLDPRTGAYTHSRCDWRGCRRIGGIVGYIRPGYGYGYDYYVEPRNHRDWDRRDRRHW